MAESYGQLPHEYVTIATPNDLVIRLIVCEDIAVIEPDPHDQHRMRKSETSVAREVHEFRVLKEKLLGTRYFEKLLGPNFKESANATSVDLFKDDPLAMKLLLQLMHGVSEPAMHAASFTTVWRLLAAAHKYGVDVAAIGKEWFSRWWDNKNTHGRLSYEDCRMVLFPCHVFDRAKGFAAATKLLSYEARSHITEKRPEGTYDDKLRVTNNIIQGLNAAKGRLKTILHRALYDPIDKLLGATCSCKEKVLFAYEKALATTGVWPLEKSQQKMSMTEMLASLDRFKGVNPTTAGCGGSKCKFDFKAVVAKAVHETKHYFDGLCLDCINHSKLGDKDEDYWYHAKMKGPYDGNCRIRHGQPTWYHSFCGRREKMIEWNNRNKIFRSRSFFGIDSDDE